MNEKVLEELEKLEQESEILLKDIDMNNMSEKDVEKVQSVLDEVFKKIQTILQENIEE